MQVSAPLFVRLVFKTSFLTSANVANCFELVTALLLILVFVFHATESFIHTKTNQINFINRNVKNTFFEKKMKIRSYLSSSASNSHMSSSASNSHSCDLEFSRLNESKVVSPSGLETGFLELGQTERLKTGVWLHPVGVSTDVEVDEVFVVVEGRGRVILKDGKVLDLFPGVVGTLIAGEETRWEVDEPLKKVWIVSK